MKLNLGSGELPLEGYLNIDIAPPEGVRCDKVGDFTQMWFQDIEEVNMSHVLEHLSWQITGQVLMMIHDWMRPGGMLTVEVPNMEEILPGCIRLMEAERNFDWVLFLFGAQTSEGEFHKAGFTPKMLRQQLKETDWEVLSVRTFNSEVRARENYPCIEAKAVKPS